MEQQMLNITLKKRKINTWIGIKTKITNIKGRSTRLKWQFVGHNARQKVYRWNVQILDWRPWLGKRTKDGPQMRWVDVVKQHVGQLWKRVVQNIERWRDYIHKWIE